MNNMTEQDNKKGNVMFMVPEIPGTPWEKAARLVQMLKDGNAKLRGELARIETQLALQGVYMSIVEDQLHAQYMKFEEMLLERLKTCGIAADEVNYIYAKLKRERQEDGQKEDLPPWPEHVSTSEIDEAIASLVKDGEIEVGDARELRKGAIKFNAKMKKCRAKMKKCRVKEGAVSEECRDDPRFFGPVAVEKALAEAFGNKTKKGKKNGQDRTSK